MLSTDLPRILRRLGRGEITKVSYVGDHVISQVFQR